MATLAELQTRRDALATSRASFMGSARAKAQKPDNSVAQFYAAIWTLFTLRLTRTDVVLPGRPEATNNLYVHTR